MGPKKGGKGKKAKGPKGEKGPKEKKQQKVADGLSLSEMTAGQIMAQIKRLIAEKDRETEEMQLFFVERSKLFALWHLAMDKVKMMKEEALNSLASKEETLKRRDAERDLQNTKLRHLQNEETKNLGTVRLHHLNYMKHLSDEIWEIQNILRDTALGKRAQVRNELRAQYEVLRSLHAKHLQSVSDMSQTFSMSIRSKEITTQRNFESSMESQTALVTQKDVQISTHKLDVLESMNMSHERLLLDIQTYFNDMTLNNFAVMHSMHDEIERLEQTNNRLRRDLQEVKKSFVAADEPFKKYVNDVAFFTDYAEAYTESMEQSKNLREVLGKKQCSIYEKEILIEILVQQLELGQKGAIEVRRSFSKRVLELQRQVSMNVLVCKLKTRAAKKDKAFFHAINLHKTTGDDSPLAVLHQDLEQRHQKLRRNVAEMEQDELEFRSNCKNPKVINLEFREEIQGLKNKKNCIGVPHRGSHVKWLKQFQGQGQDFQTRINYSGTSEAEQYRRSLKQRPGRHPHPTESKSNCTKESTTRACFTSKPTKTPQSNPLAKGRKLSYGYYLNPRQNLDLPNTSSSSSSSSSIAGSERNLKLPSISSKIPSTTATAAVSQFAITPSLLKIKMSQMPKSLTRTSITSSIFQNDSRINFEAPTGRAATRTCKLHKPMPKVNFNNTGGSNAVTVTASAQSQPDPAMASKAASGQVCGVKGGVSCRLQQLFQVEVNE